MATHQDSSGSNPMSEAPKPETDFETWYSETFGDYLAGHDPGRRPARAAWQAAHTALSARLAEAGRELAAEREKFTMHTAHVGAWLSLLTQEFGIQDSGEIKVADACAAVLDAAKVNVARLTEVRRERDELQKLVYVPGMMRCAKCGFVGMHMKMRASDGAVGIKADPAPENCPNGCGPLWRVTERQAGNEMVDRAEECLARATAAEIALATVQGQLAQADAVIAYVNDDEVPWSEEMDDKTTLWLDEAKARHKARAEPAADRLPMTGSPTAEEVEA